MRILIAMFILLTFVLPALSQEGLLNRVASLESKVDRIIALLEKQQAPAPITVADPFQPTQAKPVCYNPGGCKCGCVVTGQCVCKDCNHPQLTETSKAATWPLLPPGYRMVCDASGCRMVPVAQYGTESAVYDTSAGACASVSSCGSVGSGGGLFHGGLIHRILHPFKR